MQLSQPPRLEFHNSCRDGLRDGEIPRVDLAQHAACSWHWLRGMAVRAVHVGAVSRERTLRRVCRFFADCAVEDIWEFGRYGVEDGRVDAEVLGEDVPWRVCDPVVEHECCSLRGIVLLVLCIGLGFLVEGSK